VRRRAGLAVAASSPPARLQPGYDHMRRRKLRGRRGEALRSSGRKEVGQTVELRTTALMAGGGRAHARAERGTSFYSRASVQWRVRLRHDAKGREHEGSGRGAGGRSEDRRAARAGLGRGSSCTRRVAQHALPHTRHPREGRAMMALSSSRSYASWGLGRQGR
jgi:hypothetical protein